MSEQAAITVLDAATRNYNASGVWSLFSGGDDSLATAIVTSQAPGFRGCLHIDTGIGIPETQQYVIETCRRQGWPLKMYRAKDQGQDYEALAVKHGFPGPGAHPRACRWGERPIRERKRQPASRTSAGRRVGPLCQQCELNFADATR